jgi:hypothetical protein
MRRKKKRRKRLTNHWIGKPNIRPMMKRRHHQNVHHGDNDEEDRAGTGEHEVVMRLLLLS